MSDLHKQIVIETFRSEDDAIRAVQGLRAVGFETDAITIAGRDHDDARRLADSLEIEATEEWPDNTRDDPVLDLFRIVVRAGDQAAFARRVMVDGLVDATGFYSDGDESIYLDSSTGSGAGVASSTGTATGITPGAGYYGNTGSTANTSSGPLGQFAPSADTPDDDDDFPG